jgi:NAD(P)-dependent dehydrogenase (short-subunit alcohol dehydrogenase family)
MVAACKEKFGSVDILVNNAGIYPPAPVAQMTEADFETPQRSYWEMLQNVTCGKPTGCK